MFDSYIPPSAPDVEAVTLLGLTPSQVAVDENETYSRQVRGSVDSRTPNFANQQQKIMFFCFLQLVRRVQQTVIPILESHLKVMYEQLASFHSPLIGTKILFFPRSSDRFLSL